MADPDNIARVMAAVGAITGIGSLVVSTLTYRRGRPKLVFRDVSAGPLDAEEEDGSHTLYVLFEATLINRSQSTAYLMHDSDGDPKVWVHFYSDPLSLSRRIFRRSRFRLGLAHRIATTQGFTLENDPGHPALPVKIESYHGVTIKTSVPREEIASMSDALSRARFEAILSTGHTVRSKWLARETMHY